MDSERVKLSYDKILVSGFPYRFSFAIINPQVTLITDDNPLHLATDKIECAFNFNLKKLQVTLSTPVIQRSEEDNSSVSYLFQNEEGLLGVIKFSQPLYYLSDGHSPFSAIKSASFYLDNLDGVSEGRKIFSFYDILLRLDKQSSLALEENMIKLHLSYRGEDGLMSFNEAELSLDMRMINDIKSASKRVIINEMSLVLDESESSMAGDMIMTSLAAPTGKFFLKFQDYSGFIDSLVPQDFSIPPDDVKRLIALTKKVDGIAQDQGITNIDYDKSAKVDIELTSDDIKIGDKSLSEFLRGIGD